MWPLKSTLRYASTSAIAPIPKPIRSRQYVSAVVSTVLLIAALLMIVLALAQDLNDEQCTRTLSTWSPALDAVRYRWMSTQNISFGAKTVYVGPPQPRSEAEWDFLIPSNPIYVPNSHLADLNQSSNINWARPTPNNNTVLAIPEVFLQLRCLNLVRQHTWRADYDFSHLPAFQGSEEDIMRRLDKCFARLRHMVKCWGDATPYLHEILRKPEGLISSVDFGTVHYCRDFDTLLTWQKERGDSEILIDGGW